MIQTILDIDHCQSFKLIMTHNENIKTFEVVSKHLEMEHERLKSFPSSNVELVAKGSGPKG